MRKTNVTRWSAMMIAFVLILSSLAAPVRVAAINEKARAWLTISGVTPDAKVKFYKIVNVNIVSKGIPQEPMYIWRDNVASYIAENYASYTTANTNAVTDLFFKIDERPVLHS